MATKIQLRRDLGLNWTTINPILSDGEIGIEKNDTDASVKLKVGNGVDSWADLPYLVSGGSGGGITIDGYTLTDGDLALIHTVSLVKGVDIDGNVYDLSSKGLETADANDGNVVLNPNFLMANNGSVGYEINSGGVSFYDAFGMLVLSKPSDSGTMATQEWVTANANGVGIDGFNLSDGAKQLKYTTDELSFRDISGLGATLKHNKVVFDDNIAEIELLKPPASGVMATHEWVNTHVPPLEVGSVGIADTAPSVDGVYRAKESGTYTNLGGLVAQVGYITWFRRNGGVWSFYSSTKMSSDATQLIAPIGNQLANTADVRNGTINPSTGAINADSGKHISVKNAIFRNNTYTLSGLGNIHWPLVAVYYKNGTKSGTQYQVTNIGTDLTQITFVALDLDFDEVKIVVKSLNGSDNTIVSNIMLNAGSTAMPLESIITKTYISRIDDKDFAGKLDPIYKFDTPSLFSLVKNSYYQKKGLRACFSGDSITFGGWVNNFVSVMGTEVNTNYAVSGTTIRSTGVNNLNGQIDKMISENPALDVVVVAMGTNDYAVTISTPATLGNVQTTFAKDVASLDISIVSDALRMALRKLKGAYPNAKIFYSIPIQRASTPNSSVVGVWTFNQIVREVCNMMNVYVIDSFSKCGILFDFEIPNGAGRYLTDGLHPNPNGYRLLGNYIAKEVYKEVALNIDNS